MQPTDMFQKSEGIKLTEYLPGLNNTTTMEFLLLKRSKLLQSSPKNRQEKSCQINKYQIMSYTKLIINCPTNLCLIPH